MEYHCQKQLLGPKLVGSWLGEHPKNFGTPYLSLQPLKIVTSNLVHNFGSWSSVSEATFRTKIDGCLRQGSTQKFWRPLLISTTAEVSDFKFCTQLGLREYHTTTLNFYIQKRIGVSQGALHKFYGAHVAHTHANFSTDSCFGMLLAGPQLCTKFQVASFSSCKNKQGIPKFFRCSQAQTLLNLVLKVLLFFGIILVEPKLCTKFEVANCNGCRNKQGSRQIWENPVFSDPATGFLVPSAHVFCPLCTTSRSLSTGTAYLKKQTNLSLF